jgi:hypothetical protein
VKVDRGVTWEESADALSEAQDAFAAYEKAKSSLGAGAKGSSRKRAAEKLFGYYVTKNAFAGKHFVILVTEKIPTFHVCSPT